MTTISTSYGHDTTAAEVARDIDLTGRRVIVTGGASGIGLGIVESFLDEGARVALTYATSAEAAGDLVRRRGPKVDDPYPDRSNS